MKININDSEVGIFWKHQEVRLDGKSPFKYVTICVIELGGREVATAFVKCSVKEQFNKNKARKLSLQRAFSTVTDIFQKDIRTQIWKNYPNLKGKQRKQKKEKKVITLE